MNSDLLKKIKKLMALANSPNKHEAEVAAMKAQELMLKHNLTSQTVNAHNFDYVNEGNDHAFSKISDEVNAIQSILSRFFFVRVYFDKTFAGYTRAGKRSYIQSLRIVGTRENVEVAQYVYSFLVNTFQRLWKEYAKENKAPVSHRKSFMWGLYSGLTDKLTEQQKKVENEMGLVVVPDAKLALFMKTSLNLKSRRGNSTGIRSSDAHAQGKAQGRNINIARGLTTDSQQSGKLLS